MISVDDKALEKWAANDLEATAEPGGSYRFVFRFVGSSCTNGGNEFPARISIRLNPGTNDQWLISDLAMDVPREHAGWLATCIHGSSRVVAPEKLTTSFPIAGLTLSDAIRADLPTNNARCLCTSIHVNHKVLLALSTVKWWMDHRKKPE